MFYITHQDEEPGLIHCNTRPWLVRERYHGDYKRGKVNRIVDRYETEAEAKRRARDLNAR